MGGADKALIGLSGLPLVQHLSKRLEPQVEALAISANGDPARFTQLLPNLPVLPDSMRQGDGGGYGPLAGILAGLEWLERQGGRALVTVPVDSPFVPDDLVARLWQGSRAAGDVPVFARAGRDHYATALWPLALARPLRDFLASGAKPRIAAFAAGFGALAVDFPDPQAFDNLNSPEDLAAAEARISGRE